MKQIVFTLLIFISVAFCQSGKYLHVSTIPGNADIYVGNTAPDYSKDPDYVSPAFIPVQEGDDHILIAMFRQEFADTLIDVNLSAKDTSYLIVSLKQSYDNDLIDLQQHQIAKRSRSSLGKKLMWSSIIPFAASAIGGSITLYEISKAKDDKKTMANSKIASGDKYKAAESDFKEHRSSARTAKSVTLGTGIGGALLLTAGFILSF